MISTAVRLARVGNRTELSVLLTMLLSYPVMVVGALLPHLWVFAGAAAVSYASDWLLRRRGAPVLSRLTKAGAGLPVRFLARELIVVLLLARVEATDSTVFYAVVLCFLVLYALQIPHTALLALIGNRRKLPFEVRNIDLPGLRVPPGPPSWLSRRAVEKLLHLDLFAVVGLVVTSAADERVYALVGAAVTLVAGLLGVLLLVPYLRRRHLAPAREKALAALDRWLRVYRPTTVLYFSGSTESAYQVNMWLDTMEQLGGRPMVLLREHHILPKLAPSTVPVVSIPSGVHLMNMDLSHVRVALYPANVGKNIHLLRVPTMKHVFIGHGDSDKVASVNPFSKVYDQVWTAGKAGRDRYALADVGVRDEDIVEVGRPQLSGIQPWTGPRADRMPTVLYAPTWEGWSDDPGNTSLMLAGENIVRTLLASKTPVRVLYKPHPFTGTRQPKAGQAHQRIVALLEKANAQRAADPRWSGQDDGQASARAEARAEMARIEARLAQLDTALGESSDETGDVPGRAADPNDVMEMRSLREQWSEAYWRALVPWEHQVITGPMPHLYGCFNAADAMVSDVSSVVSDFIASGKPYAITDSAEIGEADFKRLNTAARAALILDNQATRLGELVAAVSGEGRDPLAGARRELKEYLLGPDEPSSIVRFDNAVRALAVESTARAARQAERHAAEGAEGNPAPAVPGQREGDEVLDLVAPLEGDALDDANIG
ncbi:hypothetical protein [Actinacidiphila sp. bgisy160]|uniref:hypothetical protein n=1 Tax=Actinacidiphila sp. bgisy160 TaxID=3413796 RepID=UPI003D76513A